MCTTSNEGINIQHGRRISRALLRIYDKAAERGFCDGRHWIRVELQLNRENADWFIRCCREDKSEVTDVFMGVINNYLRYVYMDENEKNVTRLRVKPYWRKFVEGFEKVRLFRKPGVLYNIDNLDKYVIRQSGNAIKTFLEIHGVDLFLNLIKGQNNNNPKYQRLKEKYGIKKDLEQIGGEDYSKMELLEREYWMMEQIGKQMEMGED